jgi:hypothetical protein
MKQIDRAALERANERRRAIGASRERRTGFAEEYMSGKIGKRDSGADIAVGIKERFASSLRRRPGEGNSRGRTL